MRHFLVRGAMFLAMLAVVCGNLKQANAGTITTTFSSNNNFHGNMFDVTTFANSLLVTSLGVNVSAEPVQIAVYTKLGTFTGFETNAAAWTLVSTTNVIGQGPATPTFVDITDFTLNANALTGMYVTLVSANVPPAMFYTNGSNTFANADLQLDLGIGLGGLFGSSGVFSPRTWNGTINYDIVPNNVVPEPSTWALMSTGLVGLLGYGWRKRQQQNV